MDNRQLRIIASSLGHRASVKETRRRNYLVECTCGFRSGSRFTVTNAAEVAVDHYLMVGRLYLASGYTLADIYDTPTDRMIEALFDSR
jgi:hypothetical protein